MSFRERVLELIKEKGISKNKLLTDLKLSKNSFVNWEERGTIPGGDTIVKIAEYFDVSVDYLLGLSGKRYREVTIDDVDTIQPSYENENFHFHTGGSSIITKMSSTDIAGLKEFLDTRNIPYELEEYSKNSEKAAQNEQPLTDKQEQVLSLAKNLSDEDIKKLIDYAELLKKAKNQ